MASRLLEYATEERSWSFGPDLFGWLRFLFRQCWEGCVWAEKLKLIWECCMTRTQCNVCSRTEESHGKPVIKLARRRAPQMHTDFQPTVRQSSTRTPAAVPASKCDVRRFSCLFHFQQTVRQSSTRTPAAVPTSKYDVRRFSCLFLLMSNEWFLKKRGS